MTRVYDLIARVYDQPEHNEITASFHRDTASIVASRPPGSWVLDVGCGTGVLAEKLQRDHCPVVGVDGSREMLAIARRRCGRFDGRVRFVRAEFDRFRVSEPCAVALASADVFNHILTRTPLVRILRRIRQNLQPGSVLVFDALSRACFERYWAERDYVLEGEGGDLVMCCSWDPGRRLGTARLVGYARVTPQRYERVETVLRERYYSDRELRSMLSEAGFHRIRGTPWSPWSDEHLQPSLDRKLWTAYVPGSPRARA